MVIEPELDSEELWGAKPFGRADAGIEQSVAADAIAKADAITTFFIPKLLG